MSICRYLDCSTSHITESEADELRTGGIEHIVADDYEYGWWVWVPPARYVDEDERADLTAAAPRLLALIDHARAQGCEHLRLDADAGVLDGLPTFEW